MPTARGNQARGPKPAAAGRQPARPATPAAVPAGDTRAAIQRGLGNDFLQRTAHNGEWAHLLSQPGEPAERQADTRAASVLSGGWTAAFPQPSPGPGHDHFPAGLPAVVAEQAGRGRSLAPADVAHFEPRFGTGLGHVRVHDDDRSAALAEAARARAFTVGSHIFFNRGEYTPGSPSGRTLLAHELAHVEQARGGAARLWRAPKDEGGTTGGASDPPQDVAFERLQVFASGVNNAARVLADAFAHRAPKGHRLFIGLSSQSASFYDNDGALLDTLRFKDDVEVTFVPGIYLLVANHLVAVTSSPSNPDVWVPETAGGKGSGSWVKSVKKKPQDPKAPQTKPADEPEIIYIENLIADPARFTAIGGRVPAGSAPVFFVPMVPPSTATGKKGGAAPAIYASPIEGRGDGQPANAPPWPVTVDGPKLVPVDSDPTFSAKVDWTANGNFSVSSQVISQIGENIHYRWERYDITRYAKQQLAKDPAGTKADPTAKPEKTLEQRIEDYKTAKAGTGTDVTGTGGAKREFSREFDDWWKDTKRSAKGAAHPGGDTLAEQLSNAAANRLALELAPVSLVVTAVGATLRLLADLFAGPRQQQEIPLEKEGIFLIRVITTPAINEDRDGKPIIRPPSVSAKVVEVTPMDRAVRESLDEPGAQLAELRAQIDLADKAGNASKAEYLRGLLADAKERFEGSPLTLLTKKRADKQKELDKFRKDYPTLSDYSRQREVEMLDDQIGLYLHHEGQRTGGKAGLAPSGRVNATLISEVTGEQYPLLLSAGPMAMEGGRQQWMVSDVTNRDGDAFTGLGDTPSAAFFSALTKFGAKAAYGRGRIGVRTAGLGLEDGAPEKLLVESAPADWALAEKRIDDLVATLALLGLMVASAGTAGALIGAGLAAARLIQRWQAGKLYLDAQTVGDVLGLLGGLGAAGQLGAGLRVQKFEKVFAITQEGRATETQLARAAEALKGAQELAKVVEVANEAINYGGLLWGNVAFIDQMMSISDQERSGAITHAAARRSRAGAISSAVQNNGLFIAGNVAKARHAGQAAEPTARTGEKTPTEPPREVVPPKETVTGDEAAPRDATEEPTGKAPAPAPVPIGERQATPAELRAALPPDLRGMLIIDEALHGDSAQVEYELDKATGLIKEIRIRCGPDARPATVALHTETARTMQKYQGFSGRVRQALSWVADLIGVQTLDPSNKPLFEAQLEIRKLPDLIEAQLARMRAMEPNARDLAEAELESLKAQLEKHLSTLDIGEVSEGAGFVAAKGLSRAKQKQYADLLAKLRGLEAGTEPHKAIRWEMYELIGGELPYETWERIYESNTERANKANAIVDAEQKRLGWGKTEQTVQTGRDEVRRLDIADVKTKRGIEVKAYETEAIYATEDIVSEVQRDAKLVKRGWNIKWVLIDTRPSAPLLEMLLAAGIIVENRTRKGADSEFESRNLPPRRPKVGAGR